MKKIHALGINILKLNCFQSPPKRAGFTILNSSRASFRCYPCMWVSDASDWTRVRVSIPQSRHECRKKGEKEQEAYGIRLYFVSLFAFLHTLHVNVLRLHFAAEIGFGAPFRLILKSHQQRWTGELHAPVMYTCRMLKIGIKRWHERHRSSLSLITCVPFRRKQTAFSQSADLRERFWEKGFSSGNRVPWCLLLHFHRRLVQSLSPPADEEMSECFSVVFSWHQLLAFSLLSFCYTQTHWLASGRERECVVESLSLPGFQNRYHDTDHCTCYTGVRETRNINSFIFSFSAAWMPVAVTAAREGIIMMILRLNGTHKSLQFPIICYFWSHTDHIHTPYDHRMPDRNMQTVGEGAIMCSLRMASSHLSSSWGWGMRPLMQRCLSLKQLKCRMFILLTDLFILTKK